jgi:hypothetical protein
MSLTSSASTMRTNDALVSFMNMFLIVGSFENCSNTCMHDMMRSNESSSIGDDANWDCPTRIMLAIINMAYHEREMLEVSP